MILRRVIVNRVRAAVGRFDAEIVAQKVARDEVAESAVAAAVIEARLDVAVTAAVDGDRPRPGARMPLFVVRSMMPAVRSPYSAGSAPVIRLIEEISRGSSDCPKTLMPSGRMMPFRRYCRPLCSPRT